MKYLNDKKIMTLAIILLVFTIGYFIVINKISYAFENDYDANFYHEQILNIIKSKAIKYAEDNKDKFSEEEPIEYVTVQELIDTSYLIPDENGNIKDPLDENTLLNPRKIRIKMENNAFEVQIEPTT